jgi:hypothetical protein
MNSLGNFNTVRVERICRMEEKYPSSTTQKLPRMDFPSKTFLFTSPSIKQLSKL